MARQTDSLNTVAFGAKTGNLEAEGERIASVRKVNSYISILTGTAIHGSDVSRCDYLLIIYK